MPWTTATTRATGFKVTAAVWNSEHVDNMNFLKEVAYAEFTADVSVTATTVGTANQIVSSGAATYEAVPHWIEFSCVRASSSTGALNVIVRDGTTVLGCLMFLPASTTIAPVRCRYRLTPTAASHTYNIAGWLSAAGTWVFETGTGGAAGTGNEAVPGSISVTRVPT
jgi:hypothetical protein